MTVGLGPRAGEVYALLRARILSGELSPGTQLPRQSELARELGVALLTLREALARLEADGLLSSEHGRGTFVREGLSAAQRDALLQVQQRALAALASGRPLTEALDDLARTVESQAGGMLCSILLLDEAGQTLTHGAAPSLPDECIRAVDGLSIGPCAGSCGTAAYHGTQVIVEDIAQDPLWDGYRDIVLPFGLRACWSTPILGAECRVLGTFALYYREPRLPGSIDQELIGRATHVAVALIEQARAAEVLRASEERFRTAFENAPIGMALVGLDGRIMQANAALSGILGYSREELESTTSMALTVPEDLHLTRDRTPRLLAGEIEPYRVEKRYRHRDGHEVPVLLDVSLVRDSAGRPVYFISQIQDITARKRAEAEYARLYETQREALQRAEQSEARYRSLIASSPDAIFLVGSDGRVVMANTQACRLLGCSSTEELIGTSCFDYIVEEDRERAVAALGATLRSSGRQGIEYTARRLDGTTFPVETWTAVVNDEQQGTTVACTVRDLTERQAYMQELEQRALRDTLTRLPNRTLLQDRLQHAILAAEREHRNIALLLMDLDRFKEINDTFGHQFGDLLLKEIGPRVQQLVRQSDTVARLGGDEFAILLPGAGAANAQKLARKIVEAVQRPYVVEGHPVEVGASIGIVLFPEHGEDADALVRRADVAMYTAKRDGSGVSLYRPDTDQYSPARLLLTTELRNAILRDELALVYQPQVSLNTGEIVGVEALVRWQHPERGTMAPEAFIGIAEHTGLIHAVTKWVMSAALRQLKVWHDAGFELRMALNLSARNLQDPQLPSRIGKMLKSVGIPAHLVTFELTESAIGVEHDRAQETLRGLRRLGVGIAIDDFGTGYSSLASLRRLPIDEIKIDQSFVKGMLTNEEDASIVRTVIDLAQNLRLRVVAEGVETEGALEALRALTCTLVQGYLLGRPEGPEQITTLLSESCPRR